MTYLTIEIILKNSKIIKKSKKSKKLNHPRVHQLGTAPASINLPQADSERLTIIPHRDMAHLVIWVFLNFWSFLNFS
jgi:hypothetical protein